MPIDLILNKHTTCHRIYIRLFALLMLFSVNCFYGQSVTVDDSQNGTALVDILLNDACATVDNVAVSSMQATGYFNNNGGAFPLQEGVIIRTGNSRYSAGPYSGNNESSQLNTDSDPFLQDLADRSGQSSIVNDVSFLEFEFVPISESLSFDYLLASNEYGDFQCFSGDVLAFVLTDLTTGTNSNLAVVPGATTPVSVKNISDNTYNATCESQNAELFASYEVENPNSTINMRGYTQVLNASATIVPGRRYKLRIVIGDSNDSTYDSAIFLSAGSFNTGVNLGPDLSLCDGDSTVLDAGLADPAYTYEWLRDGILIPGENAPTLTVTQNGTYTLNVTRAGSDCLITDEVIVGMLDIIQPVDLSACYNDGEPNTYDLTINDRAALNAAGFDLFYYASPADIANDNPIPAAGLTTYQSIGNQTIYIKLKNQVTGNFCDAEYTFLLKVNDEIAVNNPATISSCATGSATVVDLSGVSPTFTNGQNAGDFSISFYNTLADAESTTNPIEDLPNYTLPAGTTSSTVYLRVAYIDDPSCYTTTSFEIVLTQAPEVDTVPDAVACSSYILPALTNGAYFLGPNGTGVRKNPGDAITTSSTVYIYKKDNVTGCEGQSSFEVELLDQYKLKDLEGCGSYAIPAVRAGDFYTMPGGPKGTGRKLDAGSRLRTSQKIYYYAALTDGTVCKDFEYDITVNPLPSANDPPDVISCGSYQLPPLTDGNYTENKDGSGKKYNAGDVITKSTNLYVFAQDPVTACERANYFEIFITPTVADFENSGEGLIVCGQYSLTDVKEGAFYTQPQGQGAPLAKDTLLTQSQTIYYYVQTTQGNNCTDNLSFDITVKPIPLIDSYENFTLCEGDTYTLQPLTNGKYYLNSGGKNPVNAGEIIDRNITLYIYNELNGCTNESSFDITFRPKPKVERFVPAYSCSSYVLPELKYGARYYTGSLTRGDELMPGDVIDATQTIYIYNNYPDLTGCYNESTFEINILGVDVGTFENVKSCDAYTLPQLETGGYYTAQRGRGTQLMAGDVITTSQKIYVYARNGNRFICESETSFNVEISQTPILAPQADLDQCGSLTLPALDRSSYTIDYYRSPGGQDKITGADLTISEPGTYTIYRYATASNNTDCIAEDSFKITVYPRPEFTVQGGTICRNAGTNEVESPFLLESGLDPAQFTVYWELNGQVVHTGENHVATQEGIYTVRTEKVIPERGPDCNYKPTTVEVFASSTPLVEAQLTQPFADVAVITVNVQGAGTYLYSLDEGPFQESNVFYDVTGGMHEITVKGATGTCTSTSIKVNVVKFPQFFTPNSDGFNDTWNITTLADHPEARIFIFDRFGKLLKTIFPNTAGWDGSYRGKTMPLTDYWFKVTYVEDGTTLEFANHFTLKR